MFAIGEKGEVLLCNNNEFVVCKTNLELWRKLHILWEKDALFEYEGNKLRSKLKLLKFEEQKKKELIKE